MTHALFIICYGDCTFPDERYPDKMTNHKPGWQIASQYKPLTLLARDLRKHAQTHAFDDGPLVADLLAAANNLDVFAMDLERRIDEAGL